MVNDLVTKKDAVQFRQKYGISSTEPIRLKSFLQALKVMTLFRPLRDNISGMSLMINDYRFMIVNSENTLGKQHFTICHELYHLFIQDSFDSMICKTGLFDKKNKLEYTADMFAANLLLPDEGIITLVPDTEFKKNHISLSTIVRIEQYYSSSRMALLIKLEQMGLIDLKSYEKYCHKVILSAVQLGYDTSLYKKGNEGKTIGDYGEKAKKIWDSGKISESNYISLLQDIGIDVEERQEDNGK